MVMSWHEIVVHTTNDALEAISNILNDLGANGVVIEDPQDLTKEKRDRFGEIYELDPTKYPTQGIYIKAYFIENEHWILKQQTIRDRINQLTDIGIDIGENTIQINTVEEKDWENEWKKYFKPEKVSEKLVIVPSWERYEKQPNEKIIKMDPGMAFGTGTHPTTKLSIQGLESVIQQDDVVLDVGSGSGVLSIASILSGAKQVYSYDLDEVAVNSTIANRDLNDFEELIIVQQNDLLKGVTQPANIIVSNILADILLLVVDDAWNNLLPQGYFITAGIIEEKADMVQEKIEARGFTIIQKSDQEKWISFIAQKKIK